jgi:hydroxysqualene synthase
MISTPTLNVETPSGKDAEYENFPVGSWLLPAKLRPHIAIFYNFARAIDDVADNPDLSPEVKVERLSGFESAINGANSEDPAYRTGHLMRSSLLETGIPLQHCLDLITAFKQDSVKNRCSDWDDLTQYCLLSAAPVGRYLIDLHGGSNNGYGPSDALCIALQVINHLQDCQDDYRTLDRVYLPAVWMKAAGVTVQDLDRETSSPGVRQVLDQCLDVTEQLMADARALPIGVKSRRLAMESQSIINIADQLIIKLRSGDPLNSRIKLSKPGYLWCCISGSFRALVSPTGR